MSSVRDMHVKFATGRTYQGSPFINAPRLLILTGYKLDYTALDIEREGGEIMGKLPFHGIYAGFQFELRNGADRRSADRLMGMRYDALQIRGSCDPECMHVAMERVKR